MIICRPTLLTYRFFAWRAPHSTCINCGLLFFTSSMLSTGVKTRMIPITHLAVIRAIQYFCLGAWATFFTKAFSALVFYHVLFYGRMWNAFSVTMLTKVTSFTITWNKLLLFHPTGLLSESASVHLNCLVHQINREMNLKVMPASIFAQIILPLKWTNISLCTFTSDDIASMTYTIQWPEKIQI